MRQNWPRLTCEGVAVNLFLRSKTTQRRNKKELAPIQFFPFAAFTMKIKNLGSIVEVNFSAKEIALFNSTFPCSGVPVREVFFQFEKKTGDLVDESEHLRGVENGSAVSALCDEAKSFLEKVKN